MTNQELSSFCSKNAREAFEAGEEEACQDWLDALVEFKLPLGRRNYPHNHGGERGDTAMDAYVDALFGIKPGRLG